MILIRSVSIDKALVALMAGRTTKARRVKTKTLIQIIEGLNTRCLLWFVIMHESEMRRINHVLAQVSWKRKGGP